jgi:hypothetical protein
LGKLVPTGYQERSSGNLRVVAGMVLAHPSEECGFIIVWRSGGISIHPFIKGLLQRVNIPSWEFSSNLINRTLGQDTDERA